MAERVFSQNKDLLFDEWRNIIGRAIISTLQPGLELKNIDFNPDNAVEIVVRQ